MTNNQAFTARMIVWGILLLLGLTVFNLDSISILYGYIIGTINWVLIRN